MKIAIAGKGGVDVSFQKKLSNGLGGVIWFMKNYPYTCMEQKTSRAVALRDEALWKSVIAELPSHLDGDGTNHRIDVDHPDPGRNYSPRDGLAEIATYDVPTSPEVEAGNRLRTRVLEVLP